MRFILSLKFVLGINYALAPPIFNFIMIILSITLIFNFQAHLTNHHLGHILEF